MPRRKKTYRKRRPRRRKKNYSRSMMAKAPSSPLGKKFKYRARYFEYLLSLDPGASGIPSYYVFSLNGLYDPRITGVGHQPLGFDELMPMYDHYVVIGARARVTFINTADQSQICGLQIKDRPETSLDIGEVMENGLCKWATLAPVGSGNIVKEMTISFSTKKFFSKNPMDEVTLHGDISNNPVEQAYLHVFAVPNSNDNTDPVKFSITIEYIAMLVEPKQLGPS